MHIGQMHRTRTRARFCMVVAKIDQHSDDDNDDHVARRTRAFIPLPNGKEVESLPEQS